MISGNDLNIDCAAFATEAKQLIKDEMIRLNREGLIVSLSGGIDSAVVATLAAEAVGPGRVAALLLIERDGDPANYWDAVRIATKLRLRHQVVDLTPVLAKMGLYRHLPLWLLPFRKLREWVARRFHQHYLDRAKERPLATALLGTYGQKEPWLNQAIAYQRAKVRQRMVTLYYHAELENRLVLGCCDKTERSVGLFVKHGDIAADVAPIETLYKTQVRQLGNFLGLPLAIVNKPSSPDLLPGITDEYVLGIPFERLDRILLRIERGQDSAAIATYLDLNVEQVDYIRSLVRRSQHMRSMPRVADFR